MYTYLKTFQWNRIVCGIKFRYLNMARKSLHSLACMCFSNIFSCLSPMSVLSVPAPKHFHPLVVLWGPWFPYFTPMLCSWVLLSTDAHGESHVPSFSLPWFHLHFQTELTSSLSLFPYTLVSTKHFSFLWIYWLMCLSLHQPGQLKDGDFSSIMFVCSQG